MSLEQDTASADNYTSRGSYRHRIGVRCSISHSGQRMSEGREKGSVVGILYHRYLSVGATFSWRRSLRTLEFSER